MCKMKEKRSQQSVRPLTSTKTRISMRGYRVVVLGLNRVARYQGISQMGEHDIAFRPLIV
uniref:Uncharacterized protein n=1 Tax=Arundo donax TaxID=35708 RepID=A0A0A8ZD15_ARUDO